MTTNGCETQESMALPAVRLQHIGARPSLKARATIFMLRRLLGSRMSDLAEPGKLISLRRSLKRADSAMALVFGSRMPFYSWSRRKISGTRVRDIRLNGFVAPDDEIKDQPFLLYFHGGGFVFRTLNSHMRLAARIAQSAGIARAILPVYRLAPEHPFPAGMLDCIAVYRKLLDSGVNPDRIAFAGDSAGGGLVLCSLLYCREQGLPLPACAVMLSPVTDMTHSGDSIHGNAEADPLFSQVPMTEMKYYLGETAADDPTVSPLFSDFSGLPPMLVQVGSTERLLDDSLRLARGAEAAGCELSIDVYKNMPHVWQVLNMPETTEAVSRIGRFIHGKFDYTALRARSKGGLRRLQDVLLTAE